MNSDKSDSDDDDDCEIEVKKPEKHAINENLKEKFEKLKEQRLKYARKAEKKEQMRLNKGAKKCLDQQLSSKPSKNDDCMKKHITNYNSHIKNLNWEQLNDDIELKNEKLNLENSLNLAIKSNNLDLAEEVNEQLVDYESKLHINYAVSAYRYDTEKLTDPTRKPKKKLKWQFEAKERWESKANM